ncbi:MAG: RES family NAD+ phosphorylase [Brucellaceae bacterium]|nr:RES family NAD+ phosphorylase [Novosphingobium sp.]MCC0028719.1 RES family NAD+ phosphorylase [Brucellaceae bacterium]
MAKLCCPECFGDRGLRRDIIPSLGPSLGNCSYCRTIDVPLVEPSALRVLFELLISVYEADAAGQTLVDCLKADWDLFSHPAMDVAHAKELLGEILDDGDIVRKAFSPSAAYHSEALARWETLRDELMWKNRYFLDEVLDTDRLKELLGHLPSDDMPSTWYRARILDGDAPYPIDNMGTPPARLASHGRANPAGIPYLYLRSLPDTAAAGLILAKWPAWRNSLLERRSRPSIYAIRADSSLPSCWRTRVRSEQLRADIAFLERLGDELTRPVLPRGAAIDYLPSQYLCEFIKKVGYDGVVYRSSVSEGINLALFDQTKAVGRAVSLYNITKVTVKVDVA